MPVEYVPYGGQKVTMPEMLATFGKLLSAEDRARYLAAPIHYKLRHLLEAQSRTCNDGGHQAVNHARARTPRLEAIFRDAAGD